MTFAALKEGKGTIPVEKLRDHATALMKYLEGEPKPGEKLVVYVERDPSQTKEDEVAVYVGYDMGLAARGYRFTFRKKMGFLKSITIVPSE